MEKYQRFNTEESDLKWTSYKGLHNIYRQESNIGRHTDRRWIGHWTTGQSAFIRSDSYHSYRPQHWHSYQAKKNLQPYQPCYKTLGLPNWKINLFLSKLVKNSRSFGKVHTPENILLKPPLFRILVENTEKWQNFALKWDFQPNFLRSRNYSPLNVI